MRQVGALLVATMLVGCAGASGSGEVLEPPPHLDAELRGWVGMHVTQLIEAWGPTCDPLHKRLGPEWCDGTKSRCRGMSNLAEGAMIGTWNCTDIDAQGRVMREIGEQEVYRHVAVEHDTGIILAVAAERHYSAPDHYDRWRGPRPGITSIGPQPAWVLGAARCFGNPSIVEDDMNVLPEPQRVYEAAFPAATTEAVVCEQPVRVFAWTTLPFRIRVDFVLLREDAEVMRKPMDFVVSEDKLQYDQHYEGFLPRIVYFNADHFPTGWVPGNWAIETRRGDEVLQRASFVMTP